MEQFPWAAPLIGLITVLLGGGGFWSYAASRRKVEIEAQGTVINGFILLIAEMKAERKQLIERVLECERINIRQDRHIVELQRTLIKPFEWWNMKNAIVYQIRLIAGDRLEPPMCETLAIAIIKVIEDFNRTAATSAIEAVKTSIEIEKGSDKSG